jgi:hypothetical protein
VVVADGDRTGSSPSSRRDDSLDKVERMSKAVEPSSGVQVAREHAW